MGRLFWKFFFAFWLALLASGVGVGALVWLHQKTATDDELASGPRTAFLVTEMAALLRHGGVPTLRGLLEERRDQGKTPVYVVDENGRELLGREVAPETLAKIRQVSQTEQTAGNTRQETVGGHDYLFFVPADNALNVRRPPPSPFLPLAVGFLASLGFSALLAWYLAKPIRHLRGAFEAVAAGKLDTRIGPRMGRRRDEIADLSQDFDRMAEHLQNLVGSQRRLLHDVSHELRSPLARLQAAIGLARQQPEKLESSLERIERESGRLDHLVGELLTLSRLETGISGMPGETIDLMELVGGIAEDAQFEAQASGRRVDFAGRGEAIAWVHAEPLYRAFENVIRNALKYTESGTEVTVRAERRSTPTEHLFVTVVDHGPGIPEGEMQAVFEPFFRGARSASPVGFGLGLAIARRAIEAHGGSIRAENQPAGGLRVEIILPLKAEAGADVLIESHRGD
ncbi:MAG: HAMP domain-containing protein [Gammaproteobacteria bacterium]|nr:HAMP domain-containing protein [Gammaproteobacteria bacterium]MCP5426126.1 HAMP domain-containing protein [Gammaproteobacteria bacterium]